MLSTTLFDQALVYDDFFAAYGKPADKPRWDRTRDAITLTDSQKTLLKSFSRTTKILVLAGAWCGDCANQCPILEKFAELAPSLAVRYLDRDAFPDAQKELQINGGNRVPVAVFFSEDGHEVARFGERTLTQYRKMLKETLGEARDSGDTLADIVQEWLDVVERVHCILRLSPRLRRLHAD